MTQAGMILATPIRLTGAPDGRFLINTLLEEATAPITLIQNWRPEGKK